MCSISVQIKCPHCHNSNVVKNGKKSTGVQNFLCKNCGKQFQAEYLYQGADPSIKPQLQSSLLHGSGIRDCYKIFGISPKTTLRYILEQGEKVKITPRQKKYKKVQIDELYSFVNQKGKKVWIFYVYAPETKEILAVTMGKRTEKQLRSLMTQLKCLNIEIEFYCTDGFKSFKKVLPYYQHIIGKSFTRDIEGINTLIRSKIARFHRRTTKFSKKLKYQWYLFKIFVFYFNELPSYI